MSSSLLMKNNETNVHVLKALSELCSKVVTLSSSHQMYFMRAKYFRNRSKIYPINKESSKSFRDFFSCFLVWVTIVVLLGYVHMFVTCFPFGFRIPMQMEQTKGMIINHGCSRYVLQLQYVVALMAFNRDCVHLQTPRPIRFSINP